MNKVITVLSLSLLFTGMTSSALAAESCADKRQAIESEISYAKQHNNTGKLAGLEKALREVNTHCTPETLRKDAREKVAKLEKKLAEKKADILEAKNDLAQAKAQGKQNKISKYQQKVAEKKSDADKITRQLSQAKRKLSAL